MTSPAEVHHRSDSALAQGSMWAFVGTAGTRLLVNPGALRLVGIVEDENELPDWAAARPVVTTSPQWTVPDAVPDDLERSADATPGDWRR